MSNLSLVATRREAAGGRPEVAVVNHDPARRFGFTSSAGSRDDACGRRRSLRTCRRTSRRYSRSAIIFFEVRLGHLSKLRLALGM
jgi:hypothetical protein